MATNQSTRNGLSNINIRLPFFTVTQVMRDICRVAVLFKKGVPLHCIRDPAPIGSYSYIGTSTNTKSTPTLSLVQPLVHSCGDNCAYLYEKTNKIYYCLVNDCIHFCGLVNCNDMETIFTDEYVCRQTAMVLGAPQMMSYATMENQDNPFALTDREKKRSVKMFDSRYFFEEDSLFDKFKLLLIDEASKHIGLGGKLRCFLEKDINLIGGSGKEGWKMSKVKFVDTIGTVDTFYHRTKRRWAKFNSFGKKVYDANFYIHCIACLYSEEKNILKSTPGTQKWIRKLLKKDKAFYKTLVSWCGKRKTRNKLVYRHLTTALKQIRQIVRNRNKKL